MGRVRRFPDGFLWGTATSAHQVEGGQNNDWTAWEALDKVKDGSVSGRACDQWNRFEQDFDLSQQLGHNAHRFSVEWSRIEPQEGRWDPSVLQHYQAVIAALRQRGIEPFVTLWHFTNPRWLAERGGWEWNQAPARFARYAARVVRALPDVRFWTTVNEPNVYALLSYLVGEWPPEVKRWRRARAVLDRLADAHRRGVAAIKGVAPEVAVGSAPNLVDYRPARPRHMLDRLSTWWSDRWYNHRWLQLTAGVSDFIGVNHYLRQRIGFGGWRRPIDVQPQGQPQTDFGWEICPEAMYRVLRLAAAYRKPIYVTENGLADAGDRWRQSFIRDYLAAVHAAVQDGVDVRGYFHWSLVDNFEWAEGFTKRFGLVEVDFQTQQRRLRPSAEYYARICRRNEIEA